MKVRAPPTTTPHRHASGLPTGVRLHKPEVPKERPPAADTFTAAAKPASGQATGKRSHRPVRARLVY